MVVDVETIKIYSIKLSNNLEWLRILTLKVKQCYWNQKFIIKIANSNLTNWRKRKDQIQSAE